MTMTTVPNSHPYAWPYDGRLDPTASALLILGAQPSMLGASRNSAAVLSTIVDLSSALADAGVLAVAVTHQRQHRIGDPPGRRFLPAPGDASAIVASNFCGVPLSVAAFGYDGFTGSSLEHQLHAHRRTRLFLCGFSSELTVDSTIRSANDRGFECLVLTDALAPLDPELNARALHSVTMSGGIFGALGTTGDLCDALAVDRSPKP